MVKAEFSFDMLNNNMVGYFLWLLIILENNLFVFSFMRESYI